MGTLRAGSALRVGGVTLVPIAQNRIRSDINRAGYWIGAVSEPFAVVVCDARGVRALAMDSSEIALEVLIDETPNLDAVLSGLSVP